MFQKPAIIESGTYREAQRNIDVYYPVVSGLDDYRVERIINHSILTQLNQLLLERDIYEPSLVELQGWFEVKSNQRGILSLVLYVYSFTGGAHGMTTIRSITYDLQTGNVYTLKELFNSGSDYKKALLTLIKEQLKKRQVPVITEPIRFPRKDQFYIADKSLVLYYQLYDLAPYAYGIPYFPISIYELQHIIDEQGPLGTMMGSF